MKELLAKTDVSGDRPMEATESLVQDARAGLRPAQMVERKLLSLLRSGPVPMSHLRLTASYRGRGPA